MDKFQLLRLIDEGEHDRLEFKERPAKNIAAVISGFANANGGRILLGVSDTGHIVGCPLNNQERSALASAAADCDPPVEMSIAHLPEENVTILDVKQSLIKPVRCGKGYFVREHAKTRTLRSEEVGAIMRKSYPPVFEDLICEKFFYPDDFSTENLKTFAEMSDMTQNLTVEDVLLNLGLAEKSDGKLKLTNAAVLFFAEDPVKFFAQAFITCVVYNGKGKAVVVDRQDFKKGVIADIEEASKFVVRNMRVAESIKNRYRTNVYEYPLEAIKEAMVNACAHRDWAQRGGQILVEMHPGEMKVISPGGLPEGATMETIENITVRRNPRICELLQRAGLAERIGSGIKKMRQACQVAGCKPPKFEADTLSFRVSFVSNPKTQRSVFR